MRSIKFVKLCVSNRLWNRPR